MAETLSLEGGFDIKVSVALARPHEAGRAFANLVDEQQVDVLFGMAEGFAEHDQPSMQLAYMAAALDRQPEQVQFAVRAFLRNLLAYLDTASGGPA